MPVACYDLLRSLCGDDWSNDLNGDPWGPKMMLELIFLERDCEAGRNTLLAYYPKYPLMCEICAVAICDSGYSEERTFPQYLRKWLDNSQIVPVLEAARDAFSSAFTRKNIKEAWEATTLLSEDHSSIENQLPVSNPFRRQSRHRNSGDDLLC